MGQAKVRSAHRPYKNRSGANGSCGDGACAAIDHTADVGVKAVSLRGQLLVERVIEEQNFAFHSIGRKGVELLPIADDDNLGGQTLRRCGHTAAESRQDDLLRGSGCLSGPGDELSLLFTANPVRNGGFLECDFGAQSPHLAGDVVHRLLGLGRAAEARADVVGEMSELVQRVGIAHGGVAQLLHGRQLVGAPGAFAAGEHGIEAVHDRRGDARGTLGGCSLGGNDGDCSRE